MFSAEASAEEQQMLDEIALTRPARPTPRPRPPPPPQNMPPMEEEFETFANPAKRNAPALPQQEVYEEEEGEEGEAQYEGEHQQQQYAPPASAVPSEGFKTIEDEKADLLNKISRLIKNGVQSSQRMGIHSDIEEIRTEYKRMTYALECERSIKFQRKMLIAAISGLEFLNEKFDPFDVELNGWSQNVHENVDEYDGVFEELFNKYKTKMQVAPEIKLMFMLGGSAMMFHLSNSMLKAASNQAPEPMRYVAPNPEIRSMPSAAQPPPQGLRPPQMNGPSVNFGSFMGGMMPPPANTRPVVHDDVESLGDVVSEDRDVEVRTVDIPKRKAGGRKPKGGVVRI